MELMSVELGKGHKYSFICYKPETVSSHPINAIFYMYTYGTLKINSYPLGTLYLFTGNGTYVSWIG